MSDAPPRPDRIGPYPILDELGRGAMGVVYVAEDPRLRRRIALKVLPDQPALDVCAGDDARDQAGDRAGDAVTIDSRDEARIEARERFEREARFLAAINHPNIATIYTLEDAGDVRFLTMELIEGLDLGRRILGAPLPIDEALAIAAQIARALEAAHKNGIIHRDLKPLNVMVTPEGVVKVLDFGLARYHDADAGPSRGGVIVGTPGYMSPEQVHGDRLDHRADIWAFGCVLYECLTGEAAFPGETLLDRVVAVVQRSPEWDLIPPDTPAAIRELARRCLTVDLDLRIGSMAEVRRTIEGELARRTVPQVEPTRRARREITPNNLPVQLTGFVGRDELLDRTRESLERDRLVTLVGPGGAGKTRLALETATRLLGEFPDGVWLIELAPIHEAGRVPQALAATLQIKDRPNEPPAQTLVEFLAEGKRLLVIDNCEHVLGDCAALVGTLLRSCTDLRILATSRQGLGITGETIHHVPPLSLPDERRPASVSRLTRFEAIRLFLERAAAVSPGFAITEQNAEAVVKICRRLDGIPLALELAAARVRSLDVAEIARRLDDRFRLLSVGSRTSIPHHQTLRALIDWSYDQLMESERVLLRRLAVFAAGWTFPGAETVCGGDGVDEWEVLDTLSRLVDKSLVEIDAESADGAVRYRMLETVRQYAWDRLEEAGEASRYRERFRQLILALAEEAEPYLSGPEQTTWLRRLDAEHGNLLSTLDAGVGEGPDAELGLRIGGALGRYWMIKGLWNEGRDVYDRLLACPDAAGGTAFRAKALKWAGSLANTQGQYDAARSYQEASLRIQREIGDRAGIAASLASLGALAANQGDYPLARTLHEESLSIRRELGDRHGIADSLKNLGAVTVNELEFDRARGYFEESLSILRDLGDRRGVAVLLYYLGDVARKQDRHAESRAYFEEGLPIFREMGDRRLVAFLLNGLGVSAQREGDLDRARAYQEMSLAIRYELEDRAGIEESLEMFSALAVAEKELERAARLIGGAESLLDEIGMPPSEDLQSATDATRGGLGVDRFARIRDAGRDMELGRMIEYALRLENGHDGHVE